MPWFLTFILQSTRMCHQSCPYFPYCPKLPLELFCFQKNITYIENPAVRDIILNLTLTALAPQFEDFKPEDFQLWFQVYLSPVIASINPNSLRVIPTTISCESYTAM